MIECWKIRYSQEKTFNLVEVKEKLRVLFKEVKIFST